MLFGFAYVRAYLLLCNAKDVFVAFVLRASVVRITEYLSTSISLLCAVADQLLIIALSLHECALRALPFV
jgi:hypothetical protein